MANPAKSAAITADAAGNPLLGDAQTLITNAVVAHDLGTALTVTEVESALNALGVKINSVLDVLEAHGLMKDA